MQLGQSREKKLKTYISHITNRPIVQTRHIGQTKENDKQTIETNISNRTYRTNMTNRTNRIHRTRGK